MSTPIQQGSRVAQQQNFSIGEERQENIQGSRRTDHASNAAGQTQGPYRGPAGSDTGALQGLTQGLMQGPYRRLLLLQGRDVGT